MSTLTPKDHAEAIALFRSEIVGALTRRELDRGELSLVLTELSQQRFRPPRATSTKAYSIPTLERWYYAYKSGGLEALRPSARSDRGRCRELTEAQRALLAAIREEHPSASVPVILRTLVAEGRLEAGAISASSVRRFYQERGLDRVSHAAATADAARSVCVGRPSDLARCGTPTCVTALPSWCRARASPCASTAFSTTRVATSWRSPPVTPSVRATCSD